MGLMSCDDAATRSRAWWRRDTRSTTFSGFCIPSWIYGMIVRRQPPEVMPSRQPGRPQA